MQYIEISHILYALLVFCAGIIVYTNMLQRKYYKIAKWRDDFEAILVRSVTTDDIYTIDVDLIEEEEDAEDEFSDGPKRNKYKAYIISERAFGRASASQQESATSTAETKAISETIETDTHEGNQD